MKARRGAALVLVAYVGVSLATVSLAGHRALPLFDLFIPPQPYEWVKPPKLYAPGNVVPQAGSAQVSFAVGRSNAVSLSAGDGQCALSLGAGSVAPPPGAAGVLVRLLPVDPATLAALPGGLYPDGNGCLVELDAQPASAAVATLVSPGDLALSAPTTVRAVLFSADGHRWTLVPSQPVGDPTVAGARMPRAGFYLAASYIDPTTLPARHTGRAATWEVGLAVALLAAGLLLVPQGLRRLLGRA